MQRFLFRTVEIWLVLLLAILGLVAALLFGAAVLKAERKGDGRGAVGRSALALAEVPLTLASIIENADTRRASHTGKLEGKSGWVLPPGISGLDGDGYLLLSRFDGANDRPVVELVDLRDFSVRHRWTPDAAALFQDIAQRPGVDTNWNPHYFEAVHPFLLPDGSLILKDHYSPLFRVDACGRKLWSEETHLFHHSAEMDAEGFLWIPVHIQPPKDRYPSTFVEDGLAQITTDGEIRQVISLIDIYERNGLTAQVFGAGVYDDDPLHLNDIQPVLSDGPYWKKGDLFLSMRRASTVLLYRPSTGRIVWRQQGPWAGQHDVDILDDHRISVFDNRALNLGLGPVVDGANDIVTYDFVTGAFSSPLRAALAKSEIATHSEGLDDRTDAGNLIVEEENTGRLAIFRPDGALLAEFVNRADNGEVYTMSWSRPIGRAQGDAVLAAIAAAPSCAVP